MVNVRPSESIHRAERPVQHGTCEGRWHFSFDEYRDPRYRHFGVLRLLNDETLSPGAARPPRARQELEGVMYCVDGELRFTDGGAADGVLRKGWARRVTAGRGLVQAEDNPEHDASARFVELWFFPLRAGLEPSAEHRAVEAAERRNRLMPLAGADAPGALPLAADARVFSSFLGAGHRVRHRLAPGRGAYVYVLEGGPVAVNGQPVAGLGAAEVSEEAEVVLSAEGDTELLLVEVGPLG